MKTLLAFTMSFAAGSTLLLGAPPTPTSAKQVAPKTSAVRVPRHLPVIRSCASELTVKVQIDNAVLHSAYSATYNAVNINDVKVDIYHSVISGNDVMCQYSSAHQDIPNLVYSIPCPGAILANNGYAHAYRCTN
jgi:hypothetical protein